MPCRDRLEFPDALIRRSQLDSRRLCRRAGGRTLVPRRARCVSGRCRTLAPAEDGGVAVPIARPITGIRQLDDRVQGSGLKWRWTGFGHQPDRFQLEEDFIRAGGEIETGQSQLHAGVLDEVVRGADGAVGVDERRRGRWAAVA